MSHSCYLSKAFKTSRDLKRSKSTDFNIHKRRVVVKQTVNMAPEQHLKCSYLCQNYFHFRGCGKSIHFSICFSFLCQKIHGIS